MYGSERIKRQTKKRMSTNHSSFQSLEVVVQNSEIQFQATKNLNYIVQTSKG